MMEDRFDTVIIGAGQGGIPLAVNLAEAGWSVALVERGPLGGTCVNVGCTPTKAMVASARAAHVARTGADLGVRTSDVQVDLARIVERKDDIVRSFREGQERRVDRDGVELVRGEARLQGPDAVAVETGEGERTLQGDRIVINTGQRPLVPPVEGLDDVPYLTSTSIMELERVPARLMVMGGGYVGCEFAQMFSRFGSEVTVLQRDDQLLPAEDPDVAEAVREAFEEEGIRVLTGTTATAVTTADGGIAVRAADADGGSGGERTFEGSHLLVAAGRRPNTDGLGLDAAGLSPDDRGHLPVDGRFRTAVDGIWAIGDVTGRAPFTNVSYHDFQILYENWVNGAERSADGRHVTYAVYTDPPVGRVGLNERQARERGVDHEVATTPMSHVARAIEMGETTGLVKVVAEPGTRRVLGASMVGLAADEVIHVFSALMEADATWDVLADAVFAHPAVAEALPVLVRKLEGGYE